MTPQGDVHVSGSTLHGKLGIPGIEKKSLSKFHVMTQLEGLKVVQIACSDYMTLILVKLENNQGQRVFQIGGPNMKDKANLPADLNECAEVPGLEDRDIVQISCGDYHAAAIDSDGNLWTWGGGKSSQFNKG